MPKENQKVKKVKKVKSTSKSEVEEVIEAPVVVKEPVVEDPNIKVLGMMGVKVRMNPAAE